MKRRVKFGMNWTRTLVRTMTNIKDTIPDSCGRCGGRGRVSRHAMVLTGNFTYVECPNCDGEGYIND